MLSNSTLSLEQAVDLFCTFPVSRLSYVYSNPYPAFPVEDEDDHSFCHVLEWCGCTMMRYISNTTAPPMVTILSSISAHMKIFLPIIHVSDNGRTITRNIRTAVTIGWTSS